MGKLHKNTGSRPVPTTIKIMILACVVCISLAEFAGAVGKEHQVLRVIDGDTIEIEYRGKSTRVRMLNVDCPESVHPDKSRNTEQGKKAAEYTRSRLAGKKVRLEFEGRRRGRHGRLLAYVFVDGQNFCEELIRKGYSPYYTKYGKSKRYYSQFVKAEKNNIRGVLWISKFSC